MMQDFALWQMEQRYANRTIRSYGRKVQNMDDWLRSNRRTALRRASWEDIRSFAETLPYTYASRNGYVSALKCYWKFLGRSDCPAWAINCPKKPRLLPRPVTRDDLESVFNAADRLGAVYLALVTLLYYTGIRREDAATLRWAQLGEDMRLHLVGKGGIERYVPIRTEVVAALSALPSSSEYVFPGRWGGHIAAGTVNHLIRIVSEASGVPIHPHRFRHTAITDFYDATGDVFATQEFAGHADSRTTRLYTQVRWDRVEAGVLALPRCGRWA